jgi:drug/metabolite transporter (DMT)-like permease
VTGGVAFGAILLAICGGVVYHVAAKSIPSTLPPALTLVVAYSVALVVSALAHFAAAPASAGPAPARLLHPAVIGLGVGAAMIELGYVAAYRAAAPVSSTSIVVNTLVATLLLPIGIASFGESLTLSRAAGVLLCLVGSWLLRHS